jgi:hypothetical protein
MSVCRYRKLSAGCRKVFCSAAGLIFYNRKYRKYGKLNAANI